MDSASLKKELRRQLLQARMAMPETECDRRSLQIFHRWKSRWGDKKMKHVHLFMSLASRHEVSTDPFLKYFQHERPEVTLSVPVVIASENRLAHVALADDVELVPNRWGILEPQSHVRHVPADVFDMVLVPMLGFDDAGHRLGYGKGYYDRFLRQVRPDCLKVGICFSIGYVKQGLPSESWDTPLDAVVTEENVREFRLPG